MDRHLARRQEIVDVCQVLSQKGFLAGTGGNVALRLDESLFAITPSDTDYSSMGPEDIALLLLGTLEQVDGTKPASVERNLHARLLRARPERPASVHTHQPVASAVAVLRHELAWPEGYDRALLGEHVGLVPYRPSGTGMLAKAVERALRPEVHAYLLASHGVICAAPDFPAAVAMVSAIERAAALYLETKVRGRSGLDPQLRQFILKSLEHLQMEEPS